MRSHHSELLCLHLIEDSDKQEVSGSSLAQWLIPVQLLCLDIWQTSQVLCVALDLGAAHLMKPSFSHLGTLFLCILYKSKLLILLLTLLSYSLRPHGL